MMSTKALYDRLGGYDVISAVANDLLLRLRSDPQLGRNLPPDPGILRTAAQHNQVNVGVYAAVARAGTIRRGDPIRLE